MAQFLGFNRQVDLKVLADGSDDGPERNFLLPVGPIIQTVEKDDRVVSWVYVRVAQQLDQYLFKPIKCIFIIRKLGDKKNAL